MRVALVVDDSEASRHVFSSWLEHDGYTVRAAVTGAEALRILREEEVDVAIVGVDLPDMSGYEVCEEIRRNPATAWMAIIHVSATAVPPADRSEGLLRGADAFLVEPVERTELIGIVTALSRRTEARRRVAMTTSRLRALAATTADVHAASTDVVLFTAVRSGASRLADAPATLLLAGRRGATATTDGDDEERPIEGAALDELLAPARAGLLTMVCDDRRLVDRPHVGVAFVDETGEPTGAVLVPADIAEPDEVLSMLAQLSIATSLALANMRALSVEHRIALVLQRSLLPDEPPALDGLEIAFRYVAASPQAQVGGDFYEAFQLDEQTAAIAIGDVVGHSLRAATVMGELRHALRAYALDDRDPRSVVARLERLLQRFNPGMFASLIYAIVDVGTGTLRLCNAGHLPAVIVRDGRSRLEPGAGAVIGVGRPTPPLTTVELQPGDRVVLVTDGLIERRRENIDDSLQRLCAAIEALAGEPIEAMVEQLLMVAGPGDVPDDDIAVLAFDYRR